MNTSVDFFKVKFLEREIHSSTAHVKSHPCDFGFINKILHQLKFVFTNLKVGGAHVEFHAAY